MTITTYKEKKIVSKYLTNEKIQQIARDEKICPETVRKILEKHYGETGYQRGRSLKKMSGNYNYDQQSQFDSVRSFSSRSVYDSDTLQHHYPENTYGDPHGLAAKDTGLSQQQDFQASNDLKKMLTVTDQLIKRLTTIEKSLSYWDTHQVDQNNIKDTMNNIVEEIHGLQENQRQIQEVISTIQSELTDSASPLNLYKELSLTVSKNQEDIRNLEGMIQREIKTALDKWFNEQKKMLLDRLVESKVSTNITQNSFSQKHNLTEELLQQKENNNINFGLFILAFMRFIQGFPTLFQTLNSLIYPANKPQRLIPIDIKK